MATSGLSRAQNRARMEQQILEQGRRQLVERGAAALSLREIARTLEVASSAVYRYVASRDELLTLLLTDAYTSLAETVDAHLDEPSALDGANRLHVLAHAMRGWAVEHPAQWSLIYGSPVPGYQAPAESTSAPGTRVMRRLLDIAANGTPRATTTGAPYTSYLEAGAVDLGLIVTIPQAAAAIRAWSLIVGTISMEIFGQLGPEPSTDHDLGTAILDDALATLTIDLGL